MGLKNKLMSSFFDTVSELLRFNISEIWRSITLYFGEVWVEGGVKITQK